MNLSTYHDSFLLSQFREFYTEVIRLKRLAVTNGWESPSLSAPDDHSPAVDSGTWVFYPESERRAMVAALPGATSQALVVTEAASVTRLPEQPASPQTKLSLMIWQNLFGLFRRNAIQLMRVNGVASESYREAQYVMAAFADEVFIHLDWEGGRTWTLNLLETALFRTHVAGEKFFDNLDRLLAKRDPQTRDLAAVYLQALSLGFRGKYHRQNDHGRLMNYRQELFTFVFQRPSDLRSEAKIAFPDAYVQTLRGDKKKLTNPRLWLTVLGLVVVSYLLVSHVVWQSLTARLNQQLDQVETLLPPQEKR